MESDHEDGESTTSEGDWVEIERLRRENEQLRADLEDCKDQLFDLLQKENDVPEQAIKDSFNSIITGIDYWMDEVFTEASVETIFKRKFLQNIKANDKKKRFADLGLERRFYANTAWLIELSKSEACHNVVISLVISDFLTHEIFRTEQANDLGNAYPHGVSDEDVDLLVRIQKHMRNDLQRGMSPFCSTPSTSLTAHNQRIQIFLAGEDRLFRPFSQNPRRSKEQTKSPPSTSRNSSRTWSLGWEKYQTRSLSH